MLGLNQIINGYTFSNNHFKTTAGTQLIFTSEYGDEYDNVGSLNYTYPDSVPLQTITVKYVDENGTEINSPESKQFLTNAKVLTNATDVGIFEKYTITNILQTINGLKYSHSQGDLTGTKSGTVTLIYEVDQASVSDSESTSESVSDSASSSESTSESVSESDSESTSDSFSSSESISESVSDSISGSESTSESVTNSELMSDLTNGSDSLPHNNSLPNTGMVNEHHYKYLAS